MVIVDRIWPVGHTHGNGWGGGHTRTYRHRRCIQPVTTRLTPGWFAQGCAMITCSTEALIVGWASGDVSVLFVLSCPALSCPHSSYSSHVSSVSVKCIACRSLIGCMPYACDGLLRAGLLDPILSLCLCHRLFVFLFHLSLRVSVCLCLSVFLCVCLF